MSTAAGIDFGMSDQQISSGARRPRRPRAIAPPSGRQGTAGEDRARDAERDEARFAGTGLGRRLIRRVGGGSREPWQGEDVLAGPPDARALLTGQPTSGSTAASARPTGPTRMRCATASREARPFHWTAHGKGKESCSPCHSQRIAPWGACRKARVTMQNRGPMPPPEAGVRRACALAGVLGARGRRTSAGSGSAGPGARAVLRECAPPDRAERPADGSEERQPGIGTARGSTGRRLR